MRTPVCMRRQTRLAVPFVAGLLLCSIPGLAGGANGPLSPSGTLRPPPGATIIFGKDNRSHVADTSKFPWSAIGQVVSDYGFELHIGTGAMIGNKTVLTAAHVIYDQDLGWPNSIMFIPARDDKTMPFGQATAVARVVPGEWIQGNQDYDIGLVVLDKEVGKQTGIMQLATEPDGFFASQALESAGYPSDLSQGDSMYSVTGPSTGVDGKMILERITTEDGQSGSPVWFMSNGAPVVVGVIVGWQEITPQYGAVIDQGVATRIDQQFGGLINNTLAQNGDLTQQNLPDASTYTPTPTTFVPSVFHCGAGAEQALLVVSLTWGMCLISRRGWRNRL